MPVLTVGLADAKNNFSKITAEVNRSQRPVTVLKNNKPWVVIEPAQTAKNADATAIDFMEEYQASLRNWLNDQLPRGIRQRSYYNHALTLGKSENRETY